MITKDMKVSEVLKKYPQLLDVLINYDAHFELLKNPALRKVMTKLVTVEKVSRIAKVGLENLLTVLNRAIGEKPPEVEVSEKAGQFEESVPMPGELKELGETSFVHLDVRQDIRESKDPFNKIMTAVSELKAGGVLVIRNIFEPIPLYEVLGGKGFLHWTKRLGDSDYRVYFYRKERAGKGVDASRPGGTAAGIDFRETPGRGADEREADAYTIDVRGLEPPEPMVRVLEKLSALPSGETLVVTHERKPFFLFEKLREEGYDYETEEISGGLVKIRITKN